MADCRGAGLSLRSVNTTVRELATAAGLVHGAGTEVGKTHVHPHTLSTQLLRSGVDVITVADPVGHAEPGSTRACTRSSASDRERALDTALLTGR